MYYVIGSGLSGVMCAKALLGKGKRVTMLDVGVTPGKLVAEHKAALANSDPKEWDTSALAAVNGTLAQTKGKVPSRLYFNSDYMYADTAKARIVQQGTNCRMSYAQGGLAQVWGAATLPAQIHEFDAWPFGIERMAPHYEAVAKEIGITGVHDGLEELFPFYGTPNEGGSISAQASEIMQHLESSSAGVKAAGIRFGRSRLAYRAGKSGDDSGCRKCALCLSGCPFNIIFSASDTLRELKKDKNFAYEEGVQVTRLEEKEKVIISGVKDGAACTFEAERVFVACGPLGTLKLISSSLPEVRDTFALRYQPYFMLPLLSLRNFPNVQTEKLHTMAQLFIELIDKSISASPVHMQLYTYSPQIQSEVDRMFGKIPFLKKVANRFLTGRLLLIQGYLHADDASEIRAVANEGTLTLTAADERGVKRIVRKVAGRLFRMTFALGALPLLPMLKYGQPGDGNHAGASFPMKVSPKGNETDAYGRLAGWKAIHIVDSSVLSNIPAPTISYTVMANAHRIGTESVELAA